MQQQELDEFITNPLNPVNYTRYCILQVFYITLQCVKATLV